MASPEAAVKEVDVPQAVVDRLEPDVFLHECMTDRHAVCMPANPAVATHAPHLKMSGILRPREVRWVGPR